MKNYLYLLFVGFFMMLFVSVPVLADGFDDVKIHFEMGIPNAPPEINPPDIRIESVYYVKQITLEETPAYALPMDDLLPRPGWQSESARQAYNDKKQLLLSQENKI